MNRVKLNATRSRRLASRHRGIAVLLAALVVVGAGAARVAGAAVDPFYERLFDDGTEAWSRGEFGEAAGKLRLACFGMLDEPQRLATCLSLLATSQADAGHAEDEIGATVERIVEVEREFSAWQKASLSPDLRDRVEALLVEHARPASLSAMPGLRRAAIAQEGRRIASLPSEERRREIDRQISLDPDEPTWRLLWAELEWQSGNGAAALRSAELVLTTRPADPRARCVRGLVASTRSRCDAEVVADLRLCSEGGSGFRTSREAALSCLVERAAWSEAQEVLDSLPDDLRSESAFRRLAQQVEKRRSTSAGSSSQAVIAPVAEDQTARLETVDVASQPLGGAADALPEGARRRGEERSAAGPPAETGAGASGDQESAVDLALDSAVVSQDPAVVEARAAMAEERREHYERLWRPLRRAASRADDDLDAQRVAADLAFRLSRWDDAKRFYERVGDDLDPRGRLHLAIALHYDGSHRAAKRELERSVGALELESAGAERDPWLEYWTAEIRAAR